MSNTKLALSQIKDSSLPANNHLYRANGTGGLSSASISSIMTSIPAADYSPDFMSIGDVSYVDTSNFLIKKFHARKGDNTGNTGLLETIIIATRDTTGINATWQSANKTGTVAITNGSSSVVGTDTNFLSLKVGSAIRVNRLYSRRILTITDNFNLTVESPFTNTLSEASYVEGSFAQNSIYLVYWLDATAEKAGTASGTIGNYTLTGVGTNWQGGGTDSLNVGDWLEIEGDNGLYGQRNRYCVATRPNDTTITLTTPLLATCSGKKVYGAQGFLCMPSCYDMSMGDTMPAFYPEMAGYSWTTARQLPFAIKTKKSAANLEPFVYSVHAKEVIFAAINNASLNHAAAWNQDFMIVSANSSTPIAVNTTPFVPKSAKKTNVSIDSGFSTGTAPIGMDFRLTGSTAWRLLSNTAAAYGVNVNDLSLPNDGTGGFDIRTTDYVVYPPYMFLVGFSF